MKKIAFLIIASACFFGTGNAVNVHSDQGGATPLHFAVMSHNPSAVCAIIKQGADKKREDASACAGVRELFEAGKYREALKLFHTPEESKLDDSQRQYWCRLMNPEGEMLLIRVLERFGVKTTELCFVWTTIKKQTESNRPYLNLIKDSYNKDLSTVALASSLARTLKLRVALQGLLSKDFKGDIKSHISSLLPEIISRIMSHKGVEAPGMSSWARTLKVWAVGNKILENLKVGTNSLIIRGLPFEITSLIMAYLAQEDGIDFSCKLGVVASMTKWIKGRFASNHSIILE